VTTPLKALILEDLQTDAELMLHELRRAGFDPNWKRVQSEGEFLANLAPDVDVILADYHLPMFDATRALELLQQRALDIPFIVVSGTITEESAVECMKRGAYDYLLKDRLARLGPAVTRALEDRRVREGKRQVEERYRWVSENIMDAVFLLDLEGNVVFTNRRGEELTGYTEAEQRGRAIWSILAPEGAAEAQRRLQAVRSGQGVDPSFETEVVRRDGTRVSVESNVTSVFKDGQLVGRLAVVHDISTRRQAETALRDTSQRLQTLIDAAPVAIIALDEAWRVVLWNKSATRMLGWMEHEVLGQAVPTIPDHKRAEFDAAVAQNRRGIATLYETQRRRKDGALIDVISSTAPLVDARGRVTGSMGVLVDLAEQKQLEEQLRQSQKMEAVGQLAGGIAHDFNNLLTVIGGRTYLLLTTLPEKHPARPNVELIQETAERAAVLTRQLLAFSRKQILALQVLDLNTIVASIERILRRLIGEHIQLVIEPSPTPGWVKVDPGQMEQVILNLSVNARDAMPEGGRLTIRTAHVDVAEGTARTHTEIEAGRTILLEVRDTGVGMSDEIRTRIFEPFFTTKPAGHGTRTRAGHGVWHRQAERRQHRGLEPARSGQHLSDLPAEGRRSRGDLTHGRAGLSPHRRPGDHLARRRRGGCPGPGARYPRAHGLQAHDRRQSRGGDPSQSGPHGRDPPPAHGRGHAGHERPPARRSSRRGSARAQGAVHVGLHGQRHRAPRSPGPRHRLRAEAVHAGQPLPESPRGARRALTSPAPGPAGAMMLDRSRCPSAE